MPDGRMTPMEWLRHCQCGPDARCVECSGCDCAANPGRCEGPGCMSETDYDEAADECQWPSGAYNRESR